MCRSIADGGDRCPKHRHGSIGMVKAVRELNPGLNQTQIERLLSELRREGRDSNIPKEIFDVIRSGFIASHPELSEKARIEIEKQFALSEKYDDDIDSATIYALSTLTRRAKEREAALNSFLDEITEQSGLTREEVKNKFWEEYSSVDTSRGSEAPEEYDQNTRRRAVLANLPYDRASVVAIERLKKLTTEDRIVTAPEEDKVRRVFLMTPAVPSAAVKHFGWHNGRMEIVFHSNPDRIYAYRNVSEQQWVELRESTSPGRAWRFLRSNPDHAYETQEEADNDAYAVRCVSCGQYRSMTGHTCPQLKAREALTASGLSTEEINTELSTSHPENPVIADETEESSRPLDQETQIATEEALEQLRAILAGDDTEETSATEEETPVEEDVAPRPARAVRQRRVTSDTPEKLALSDIPDLRSDRLNKIEENDLGFVYDDERFVTLDALLAATKNDTSRDPIYNALLGRNEDFKPLIYTPKTGHHLIKVEYEYELRRLEFVNEADRETLINFLKASAKHFNRSDYRASGGIAILEVKTNPRSSYSDSEKVQRIVSFALTDQVDTDRSTKLSSLYSYVKRYSSIGLTPIAERYKVKERTEEERDTYDSNFEKDVEKLISDGDAVRVQVGSTIKISALNQARGFTGDDGSIRSNLPGKPTLAAAYKDGKAVITSIDLRYQNAKVVRDGIKFGDSTYTTNAELTGEVITRMTPEGEVQIIGQNLKCNCRDYRTNYNCEHIGLASQDIPKIYQAHSKPRPVLPGVGTAGAAAVREARSTTYSVGSDENGRAFVKVSMPRRGTVFSRTSVAIGDPDSVSTDITSEDTQRMNALLASDEDAVLSIEDRQFIHSYYNKAVDYERRARSRFETKVVPINNQSYLSAIEDSNVELPVVFNFPGSTSWNSIRVEGRVMYGAGSTSENPIVLERSLKCSCATYRSKYRCEHIEQVESRYIGAYLLNTSQLSSQRFGASETAEQVESPIISSNLTETFNDVISKEINIERTRRPWSDTPLTREEAIAEIEEVQARLRRREEELERERQERMEAERVRIEKETAIYNDYRQQRLAAWQTSDAPLAADMDAFREEVADLRRRKRRGEKVLEMQTENVTDGICAPGEGTRSFGIELEFDIKRGVDRRTALSNIAKELHEAGLTDTAYQQSYHSSNGEWSKWSFEEDCTVDGEIVSPVMKDTPEHWEELRQVIEIVERNGGKASTRAGSHVNISSGSFAKSTAKHAELTRIMKENEATMFRLASDPGRGSHRGNNWCRPNLDVAQDDIDEKRLGRGIAGTGGTHGMMVNYDHSLEQRNIEHARVEYRLWDSTLDVGVIQQQVAISAALTDLAEREVMQNKGYKKKQGNNPVVDDETKAARLFDRLFRTSEQRKQATRLFAITNAAN